MVSLKKLYYSLISTVCLLVLVCLAGCSNQESMSKQKQEMERWLIEANLSDAFTKEELYERALKEDILVIYSVSSRVFEVKESFEQEYPGLTVEVKDIRVMML